MLMVLFTNKLKNKTFSEFCMVLNDQDPLQTLAEYYQLKEYFCFCQSLQLIEACGTSQAAEQCPAERQHGLKSNYVF